MLSLKTELVDLQHKQCLKCILHAIDNINWKVLETNENLIKCREKINPLKKFPSVFSIYLSKVNDKTQLDIQVRYPGLSQNISEVFNKSEALENLELLMKSLRKVINDFQIQETNEKRKIQHQINIGLICPTCLQEVSPGVRFCPDDGTEIKNKLCNNCNSTNAVTSSFCTKCGNYL